VIVKANYFIKGIKDLRREASGSNELGSAAALGSSRVIRTPRDVIGPVFQPDCRLVAVTLPQGGINDKNKKNKFNGDQSTRRASVLLERICNA
jgi:hypothetical protein